MVKVIVVGLYTRYETRQAMAQLEKESKLATRNAPEVREYYPPRLLSDGERCLQGRRFKCVSNGWVQLTHDPC